LNWSLGLHPWQYLAFLCTLLLSMFAFSSMFSRMRKIRSIFRNAALAGDKAFFGYFYRLTKAPLRRTSPHGVRMKIRGALWVTPPLWGRNGGRLVIVPSRVSGNIKKQPERCSGCFYYYECMCCASLCAEVGFEDFAAAAQLLAGAGDGDPTDLEDAGPVGDLQGHGSHLLDEQDGHAFGTELF